MTKSVWGMFRRRSEAGKALELLESSGFQEEQIAIQKEFHTTTGKFSYDMALYSRLPEGILRGFVAGPVVVFAGACVVSQGIPSAIPTLILAAAGCAAGSVIGAGVGMLLALVDGWKSGRGENLFTIGVLCSDADDKDRAQDVLLAAGATAIEQC